MDKKELETKLIEKEKYLEQIKVEFYSVTGQIVLLKEMIKKLEDVKK